MSSAIELRNVTRRFQGPDGVVTALEDVSLRVAPGEIVSVEGRSGSGKTTLLLAAGGLLAPDSGTVLVARGGGDGTGQGAGGPDDLYALSPSERSRVRATRIGFVFQQFHLIPYLSVLENILAPALARDIPDARERARELAGRFGLTERLNHVPAELSVGERQRTAMARAMLTRPLAVLADEPTGNLDRENAQRLLDALAAFASDGGAVLLVTHDTLSEDYVSRRHRLEGGKLLD